MAKSIENMTFEEALNELEEIVKRIDTGEESLEEAVISYQRGVALKEYCELILQHAKLKVEKINVDADDKTEITEIEI